MLRSGETGRRLTAPAGHAAARLMPSEMHLRFFFVHVMKTGGISFRGHLLQQFSAAEVYPDPPLDWRVPFDIDAYVSAERILNLPAERTSVIRVYSGHVPYVVTEMMPCELVTMTMLRDPVERTVSVLRHFKRLVRRCADLTLEEIYEDDVVYPYFIENHQTKVFALTAADEPGNFASAQAGEESAQSAQTIVVDGARLALAKENLDRVDVVGITGDYPAFARELRRRFGWWPGGVDLELRENVGTDPWTVDEGLRRRIAGDNEADMELYRYAVDLVGRRGQ